MKHRWRSRFPNNTVGAWYNPVDDVEAAADVATSAWNDAVDAVPGARDVADAIDSVATGPVRDFARTVPGRMLLTTLASSLTGGLAPVLGPQLATVAFALPGMAAGESFVQAWTQEFASRVKQTAQILGTEYAGQIAQDALGRLDAYASQYDLAPLGRDFKRLAKLAGTREDYAAIFLDGFNGWVNEQSVYLSHLFDARTGEEIPAGPSQTLQALQQITSAAKDAVAKAQAEVARGNTRRGLLADASFRVTNVLRENVDGATQPPSLDPSQLTGAGPVAASFDRAGAPAAAPEPGLSTPAKVAVGVGLAGALALAVRAVLRT